MKKMVLFVALVATVGLTSCKKDYTCECSVDGEKFSTTMKDVKKKDADKACDTWGSLYTLAGGSCSLK